MKFKVTWSIDYKDNDIFVAKIKDDSDFIEDFNIKQISSDNIDTLIIDVYSTTRSTVGGTDVYGNMWENTEIKFEITEVALHMLQNYKSQYLVSTKLNGCLMTIILVVLIYLFIKYVLCGIIFPSIQPLLLMLGSTLIHYIK